jgi:CheY-like chemotaxis protein
MKKEVVILLAEDDKGHAELVMRNLKRAGLNNQILHFMDGEQVLTYLFSLKLSLTEGKSYLLLLDIRMPKVDGVEVLKRIKEDETLKNIPVIMVTTTDDPFEIELCHSYGCNNYIAKPVEYDKFMEAIRRLGMFLEVVEVPDVKLNTVKET